jgi:superfamily II DNA or RNA helicase
MSRVPVIVDSHLRVDGNLLGSDLALSLIDEVTIENEARKVAKRMKRWGWQDMPAEFVLAELDGDTLILPRGFALRFKQILRDNDRTVRWIDRTCWEDGPAFGPEEFSYRPHQPEAIHQMIRHRQGFYKAPTGSGKTVTVVGMTWALHPKRVIILVNAVGLLEQWRKSFHQHTALKRDEVGIIGNGKFEERRITIATVQTLHKRRDELIENGFFTRWPIMVLDEGHHATAATFYDLVDLFTSRYRLGVTATPQKTGDFKFGVCVLGEIFHEDDEDHLIEMGVLVKPHVEVVHTNYTFPYHGPIDVEPDEKCPLVNCKRDGTRHGHKDNYQKLKDDIVADKKRNELIINNIQRLRGMGKFHQLVITSEIRHIEHLLRVPHGVAGQIVNGLGDKPFESFAHVLTGKQKKQAEEIKDRFAALEEGVLFSTVAGEGMDVPVIDVIHIVYPVGNPGTVDQWIGRGTRVAEGKTGTIIFDYADTDVSILSEQFRKRRWKVYEKKGLTVIDHENVQSA